MEKCNNIVRERKLKLLFIAPLGSRIVGGITKWTRLSVEWLHENDGIEYKIVDITPRFRKGFEKKPSIRIVSGLIQLPLDITKVLIGKLSLRPDILHMTTSGSYAVVRDIAILMLSHLFGIKTVYHIHMGRIPELALAANWEWRLLKKSLKLADRIIVMDPVSLKSLEKYVEDDKLSFVPNMIDVESFNKQEISDDFMNLRGNRNIILYLGWIIPQKGLLEMVKAWEHIDREGWELVLIGPGPGSFRQALEKVVEKDRSIRILNEVSSDQAKQWMKAAEIFILPSHTEGFPNVILEAMAASKPIIATPVGAISEMLDFEGPEPCGLMVPIGDEDALGQRMKEMMSDRSLRTRLGKRAFDKVNRSYGSSVVFNQLYTIWREAAGMPE